MLVFPFSVAMPAFLSTLCTLVPSGIHFYVSCLLPNLKYLILITFATSGHSLCCCHYPHCRAQNTVHAPLTSSALQAFSIPPPDHMGWTSL